MGKSAVVQHALVWAKAAQQQGNAIINMYGQSERAAQNALN